MAVTKTSGIAACFILTFASVCHAQTAVCWDEFAAGRVGTAFLLSVDGDGSARVVRSFDPPGGLMEFAKPSFEPELATEVLFYRSTGLDGFNSLGTSFFLVVSPDATDNLQFPYLIVFDWTTNVFNYAGVPFLAGGQQLLVAWTEFECLRLE